MFKHDLIVVELTESTQDMARKMAIDGAPSGTAVMALNQIKGRGRSASEWYSPPGKNLALSVVLRPSIEVRDAPLIGMLASISVAMIFDSLCQPFKAFLKWPNDVLVQDKKISGILSEARILETLLEFIVLGVGINVNSTIDDFPTQLEDSLTSFLILTGKTFDLKNIGTSFLKTLGELVTKVETEGPDFVPFYWEKRWRHKGRNLLRDGIKGTATGIDSDGSLLMKLSDGKVIKISSGPIFTV